MAKIGKFDLDKATAIVAAIDREPMQQARIAAEQGADVLEIRFDLLGIKSSEEAIKLLEMIRIEVGLPCIATNRLQTEGGNWEGSEEERIEFLEEITHFSDAIDIELSAKDNFRDRVVKKAKEEDKTVIISSHDFKRSPAKEVMKNTLARSIKAGADIAKLAVMPESMQDVLDLLEVTLAFDNVCTISMGQLGKHSRIVASCYGSKLTYASISDAIAPGQLKVMDVRQAMEMLE